MDDIILTITLADIRTVITHLAAFVSGLAVQTVLCLTHVRKDDGYSIK